MNVRAGLSSKGGRQQRERDERDREGETWERESTEEGGEKHRSHSTSRNHPLIEDFVLVVCDTVGDGGYESSSETHSPFHQA